MAIADMQRHLQSLYDIRLDQRVEDYLVTDPAFPARMQGDAMRETTEKLLFCECEGELLLSLYLDEELVEALSRNDPYRRLDTDNLDSFCTALEGVSHFVYLVFNATHERPVSQLELELQAEVDKFFAVSTLSEQQGNSLDQDILSRWLFDHCRFDPALDPNERNRYQDANRLARAFCNRVRAFPVGSSHQPSMVRELRRFYRKRHLDKIGSALSGVAMRAP
jgi:hypothetical protein